MIKRELSPELKAEIDADPFYFSMQGGSDGTFGNAEYWADYGEWEPEISKYADEVCRKIEEEEAAQERQDDDEWDLDEDE